MTLRVEITFPALADFVVAVNRYLDRQDGMDQKRIDELTAELAASTSELESSMKAAS